jgi:hypothetical protein
VAGDASAAKCRFKARLRFFLRVGVALLLAHYVNPLPGKDPIKIGTALRCIYCGNSAEPLGIEHAVPEAIGGGLLLTKATCPCGPKLTHGFEGAVTRQIFQQVRRQLGIKGKKRKRTPDEMLLPVFDRYTEDMSLARKVSIENHPSMLTIPRIKPLSRLGHHQELQMADGHALPVDFWHLTVDSKQRIERLKQQGHEGAWLLQNIEITPFFRLLAKIAHTCAVAALGYDGFDHLLIPGIRDDASLLDDLVGELPAFSQSLFPFDYRRGLHEVAVGINPDQPETLFVNIRLFSNLMRPTMPHFTPAYAIVAGTLTDQHRKKINF